VGRARGRIVALLAAGVAAPLGCGLATAGLGAPDDAKPHDGGVADDRRISPDVGAGFDAGDADVAPPPGDDATSLDAPADAPGDAEPPDAPAPPCATGVLFCDGFEQGLGAWPNPEQTNGTIGLSTTRAHRGMYSVDAHENAITQGGGNPYVSIDHTQTWPPHFWVRFFVYVPSPFPPSNAALLNLIQSSGAYPGIQLFLTGGKGNVAMTTFLTGNDHTWQSATISPLDQWVCFEVEADVPNGTVHVSMNDTHLTDLDMMNISLPSPDTTKLGLGFFMPNVQGAYDVWFDDVIVDDNPIGCTK
jgi:hypothetical protein